MGSSSWDVLGIVHTGDANNGYSRAKHICWRLSESSCLKAIDSMFSMSPTSDVASSQLLCSTSVNSCLCLRPYFVPAPVSVPSEPFSLPASISHDIYVFLSIPFDEPDDHPQPSRESMRTPIIHMKPCTQFAMPLPCTNARILSVTAT